MDFYSDPKKLNIIRIALLIGFMILFSFNLILIIAYKSDTYLGLIGNVLMAIAMIIPILKYYKDKRVGK